MYLFIVSLTCFVAPGSAPVAFHCVASISCFLLLRSASCGCRLFALRFCSCFHVLLFLRFCFCCVFVLTRFFSRLCFCLCSLVLCFYLSFLLLLLLPSLAPAGRFCLLRFCFGCFGCVFMGPVSCFRSARATEHGEKVPTGVRCDTRTGDGEFENPSQRWAGDRRYKKRCRGDCYRQHRRRALQPQNDGKQISITGGHS